MPYTSYQLKTKYGLRRHDPGTRAMLAERFQVMYRSLGLDLAGCAKLLHVTERTLHNWQSGKHDIPYATYRLMRMLCGMELPGQTWEGWTFSGGKLWSPEGRSFVGTDSAWWSLLVRRADFSELLRRKVEAQEAEAALRKRSAGRCLGLRSDTLDEVRMPVTPHFSLTDETFLPFVTASNASSKEAA